MTIKDLQKKIEDSPYDMIVLSGNIPEHILNESRGRGIYLRYTKRNINGFSKGWNRTFYDYTMDMLNNPKIKIIDYEEFTKDKGKQLRQTIRKMAW